MSGASALFTGKVTHRRARPRRHALTYRVFWMLLDLDEIEALDARLRVFSRNRFNLLSFHDADHGWDGRGSLRQQIERRLVSAGIAPPAGPMRLLTMPRVLGYVFNPISIFFCHHADGRVGAIVYEVNNTFGQRHFYIAPAGEDAAAGAVLRHGCRKEFYVSPFMGMDLSYDFTVRVPDDQVALGVNGSDADGLVIATAMSGVRRPMTDARLFGALVSHPLLTLKVIAGIHYEALKLWLKGVPLTRRPAPPADAVTLIPERQA